MARVIGGGAEAGPGPLVVEVTADAPEAAASPRAIVRIRVADADLAARLEGALAERLQASLSAPAIAKTRTVRIRSRAGLIRRASAVPGAVVLVPVTRRNAAALPGLVAAIGAAGAAGIQLIWDGRRPPREVAEAPVFEVLEERRGRPEGAPVLLASVREPVEALRRAVRP